MTDATASPAEMEAVGDEEPAGGKKKLLLIVVALLLVVGAIGAGLVFSGVFNPFAKKEAAERAAEAQPAGPVKAAVFLDLPDILVNLNSANRRTNFLKISISLEVGDASDVQKLQALMPRIVDSFQVYLRELRLEDLRGSAGMYRLREDLLRRINEAARPVKVNDVLFKELLVQ